MAHLNPGDASCVLTSCSYVVSRGRSQEWHNRVSGHLLASNLLAIRDSFRPDHRQTKIWVIVPRQSPGLVEPKEEERAEQHKQIHRSLQAYSCSRGNERGSRRQERRGSWEVVLNPRPDMNSRNLIFFYGDNCPSGLAAGVVWWSVQVEATEVFIIKSDVGVCRHDGTSHPTWVTVSGLMHGRGASGRELEQGLVWQFSRKYTFL